MRLTLITGACGGCGFKIVGSNPDPTTGRQRAKEDYRNYYRGLWVRLQRTIGRRICRTALDNSVS